MPRVNDIHLPFYPAVLSAVAGIYGRSGIVLSVWYVGIGREENGSGDYCIELMMDYGIMDYEWWLWNFRVSFCRSGYSCARWTLAFSPSSPSWFLFFETTWTLPCCRHHQNNTFLRSSSPSCSPSPFWFFLLGLEMWKKNCCLFPHLGYTSYVRLLFSHLCGGPIHSSSSLFLMFLNSQQHPWGLVSFLPSLLLYFHESLQFLF